MSFTRGKIHSIFLRMPDIRRLLGQSFRKMTAICPFEIVRGTTASTEAGYQPQGAQPRDFTDFEQLIDGFDPIIVEWEDSVAFPFDGTMDQRYENGKSVKVTGINGKVTYEKEMIYPLGSVFQYEGMVWNRV